jgi:hypothetical protein
MLTIAAIVLVAGLLLAGGVGAYFEFENRDPQSFKELAERPHFLRKASTQDVIRACLAKPEASWAWSELRRRAQSGQLTRAQADGLIRGLTHWLTEQHPNGYDKHFPSLHGLAESLTARQLVSEENIVRFLKALHGNPSIEPLARAREGQAGTILVSCQFRNVWHRKLFDKVMLNELKSVSIVGVPAENYEARVLDNTWSQEHATAELGVGNLRPGKYVIRCEFEQAVFSEAEIAGLPRSAPSSDWPAVVNGSRRWRSTAEAELKVLAKDQQTVQMVTDPALDPVAGGWTPVKSIFIRAKADKVVAVLVMNTSGPVKSPVSAKVKLQIGEETYLAGSFLLIKDGKSNVHTSSELTVEVRPPEIAVTNATVTFEPDPLSVESRPDVDRIWGNPIITTIPLIRQAPR